MLKLYGNLRSRATRCIWMLEEMGEPYELVETSVRPDDLQNPAYLRLNPNARIPTLVGGDTVLWESMAINLYLAQKPGPMHVASAGLSEARACRPVIQKHVSSPSEPTVPPATLRLLHQSKKPPIFASFSWLKWAPAGISKN